MERNYRVVKRNNVVAKKLVSRDYGHMCNELIFIYVAGQLFDTKHDMDGRPLRRLVRLHRLWSIPKDPAA